MPPRPNRTPGVLTLCGPPSGTVAGDADGRSILGAVSAAARSLLRRLGLDVVRYAPRNYPHLRRPALLAEELVDVVLDVGASDGSWARALRADGYAGRIVSFEPLAESFAALEQAADWEAHRLALGDRAGRARLHVTANRQSSSLLPLGPRHARAAPEAGIVGAEEVEVARLDDLSIVHPGEHAYLKLDVQGAEREVLRGAARTLESVRIVETELSAVELYDGQALLGQVVEHLRSAGFDLIGLEPSFRDRSTGDLLQANGWFRRRNP
jgi:FkbM family methyltransferase